MRFRVIFTCIILLIGVSLVPVVGAQSRSVFWDNWDVTITDFDLEANAFTVNEIYDISFTGEFRAGMAFIPNERLEQITNVVVYQDGSPLRLVNSGETPGTYTVAQVSDGVVIDYFFNQPIRNGRGSFTIEYRVVGALRSYEGGDQLWWTAVPQDKFGFSVGASTITVELPPELAPREGIDPVVTYGAPANVDVVGSTVTAVATRRIGANDDFEIRVQFPHTGLLRVPGWQANFDEQRSFEENVKPLFDLGFIVAGIFLLVGGPMAVYWRWYTKGRDPKIGPVPSYLSEPPSDLPPAVVGSLIDERADTRDVISTLIDLAHREYLVIQEDRKEGLFGIGASSTFTFKRTDKPLDDLRAYERKMLGYIFTGNSNERTLDSLQHRFYQYMETLKKDLYEEMVKEGLFTDNPDHVRQVYSGMGVGVLVLAGVLFFFATGIAEELTATVMCLPAALGVTGLALSAVGQHMPHKTQKGAEEAAKWNAFQEYLQNLDRYAQADLIANRFDEYLPYAVAFGIDRSWIRRFSRVSATPMPTWYYPTYRGGRYSRGYTAGTPLRGGGSAGLPSSRDVMSGDIARAGGGALESMSGGLSGGLESMSQGLSRMLDSASRTLTSTPPSANSGSSGSWSGGGRSFSGGGSFRGGSSGGGSRGFR